MLGQLEDYWPQSYEGYWTRSDMGDLPIYHGAQGFFDHQPTLNAEMALISCRNDLLRDLNRLQLMLKKKKVQKPEEVEQLLKKTLKNSYWLGTTSWWDWEKLSSPKKRNSCRKSAHELILGKVAKVTPSAFGEFLEKLYDTSQFDQEGSWYWPEAIRLDKGLVSPSRTDRGYLPYVHIETGWFGKSMFPHFYRKHYQRAKENGALSRRWQWWDQGDEWRKAGEWLREGGVEIKGNGRFAVRTRNLKYPPH